MKLFRKLFRCLWCQIIIEGGTIWACLNYIVLGVLGKTGYDMHEVINANPIWAISISVAVVIPLITIYVRSFSVTGNDDFFYILRPMLLMVAASMILTSLGFLPLGTHDDTEPWGLIVMMRILCGFGAVIAVVMSVFVVHEGIVDLKRCLGCSAPPASISLSRKS